MINEFVPYTQARALKKLGFDEYCLAYYMKGSHNIVMKTEISLAAIRDHTSCKTPLYQQAFRWFRKNFGGYHGVSDDSFLFELTINGEFIRVTSTPKQRRLLNSYEEFEEACLREMIEIVKDETN